VQSAVQAKNQKNQLGGGKQHFAAAGNDLT
jgi:hypothetical protein